LRGHMSIVLRSRRAESMTVVRSIGACVALVFASSVALADDPPATSSSSAAPPNAPIVLSPGVSATPSKPAAVAAPPERGPRSEGRREWFGYQTLVVDIAIVSASAGLLRTTSESNHLAIFIAGSVLYLGAGPLIHFLNKSDRVTSSLIIRAAALGIGAIGGALLISGFAGCTEATPCKLELVDFAAIGAGAGAMIGTIVDSGTYAWKVVPTVARTPGGASFGVAVAF